MSVRRPESERLADLKAKAAAIEKRQAERKARASSENVRKLERAAANAPSPAESGEKGR